MLELRHIDTSYARRIEHIERMIGWRLENKEDQTYLHRA